MLAGSQLTVASEVTIDGGAGVTVDAKQASRVLEVSSFPSMDASRSTRVIFVVGTWVSAAAIHSASTAPGRQPR